MFFGFEQKARFSEKISKIQQLDSEPVVPASAAEIEAIQREVATIELDLIVLDIMLPHLNGYQVVRSLRRQGSDIPVILLSAKSAELDIVMGLDLGADDYVTKPFRVAELLARVKAHLRRRNCPVFQPPQLFSLLLLASLGPQRTRIERPED